MFRNMKVGTRLILCFLAVALLGAIVAGIGIHNMDQMNERAKRLYDNHLLGLSYVKEANINLVYINRAVRGGMLAATDERRATSLANVDVYRKAVLDNLDKARPLFDVDEGKRLFAQVDNELRNYDSVIEEQVRKTKAEPLQEQRDSVGYMFDTFMPRSTVIDNKMTELTKLKEKLARQANEENKDAYTHGRGRADRVPNTTPELRAQLQAEPPRVPASERRRHPRLELLQTNSVGREHAHLTALVRDGERRYTVRLELAKTAAGWLVSDLER